MADNNISVESLNRTIDHLSFALLMVILVILITQFGYAFVQRRSSERIHAETIALIYRLDQSTNAGLRLMRDDIERAHARIDALEADNKLLKSQLAREKTHAK